MTTVPLPCTLCLLRCYLSDHLVRRLLILLAIFSVAWLLVSPSFISAYAGLGGYISEKMLGGATNASLYLGDSSSGPVVIGSGPVISTGGVTNNIMDATGTVATLHGTLGNLNGFPQADYWFVWGESPTAMTNVTPAVTVTTTGDKTADISGYHPSATVYYQFRSSTDGTSIGLVQSFRVAGGRGWAHLLLWLLLIIIAAGIFIAILRLTGNPVAALLATIIGIIAFYVVRAMLESLI